MPTVSSGEKTHVLGVVAVDLCMGDWQHNGGPVGQERGHLE